MKLCTVSEGMMAVNATAGPCTGAGGGRDRRSLTAAAGEQEQGGSRAGAVWEPGGSRAGEVRELGGSRTMVGFAAAGRAQGGTEAEGAQANSS